MDKLRRRIQQNWSPEQALAVYELLNDLQEAIWEIHEPAILDILVEREDCSALDPPSKDPDDDFPF